MAELEVKEAKKATIGEDHPFRRAVMRGLGLVLPPLLTIVVFLWGWNLIYNYVLEPIEGTARSAIVWGIWDVRSETPADGIVGDYRQLRTGRWIPRQVYESVQADPGETFPETARAYYDRYVSIRYLRRSVIIPMLLAGFILVLYILGRLFAAGIGRFIWGAFEKLIQQVPVIRNVYSAVKQVTDFIFSEQEIEFNRVVAVEYPRKGIWSIGFVTGESMLDIRTAANEPVLSVLMPTSPMPATGFTITVLKSETIDLDISVDQAIQFIVSCGVVVPEQQMYQEPSGDRITSKLLSRNGPSSVAPRETPSLPAPSDNGDLAKSQPADESHPKAE